MPEIWLSYNNNAERLQLPVNPPELQVSNASANDSIDVQRLGEVTIINDPKAKTFQFSSFFPFEWGPFVATPDGAFFEPWIYAETIERWKNSGNPIRFIVTDTPINYAVSIEAFDYKEVGGDVGTLSYDITLKEYKFIRVRQIEETTDANGDRAVTVSSAQGQRPDEREKPTSYTVVGGDSLIVIGRRVGVDWQKIANVNGIIAPYTIYPGQVLKIP